MAEKSNLLTPDDEIIKKRIANKPRVILSEKQIQQKINRMGFDNCGHLSIKYVLEDGGWKCMKCNKLLIKCSPEDFRLFCELAGKDPKSLLA